MLDNVRFILFFVKKKLKKYEIAIDSLTVAYNCVTGYSFFLNFKLYNQT